MADLRAARGTSPPPVQILSISGSFWENLAKSYVGTPRGELAPPPRGNPGSATDNIRESEGQSFTGPLGLRVLFAEYESLIQLFY